MPFDVVFSTPPPMGLAVNSAVREGVRGDTSTCLACPICVHKASLGVRSVANWV